MYDHLKTLLQDSVPFAAHTGVEIDEIGKGTATTRLAGRDACTNHIGTTHAGALFTLAEAASGAAMAGALAPVLAGCRPVAANATIRFLRSARGDLVAHGKTVRPAADLLDELCEAGKIQFAVEVGVIDAEDAVVAQVEVDWHVRLLRQA